MARGGQYGTRGHLFFHMPYSAPFQFRIVPFVMPRMPARQLLEVTARQIAS